jgi:hypothetical protein
MTIAGSANEIAIAAAADALRQRGDAAVLGPPPRRASRAPAGETTTETEG